MKRMGLAGLVLTAMIGAGCATGEGLRTKDSSHDTYGKRSVYVEVFEGDGGAYCSPQVGSTTCRIPESFVDSQGTDEIVIYEKAWLLCNQAMPRNFKTYSDLHGCAVETVKLCAKAQARKAAEQTEKK